VRWTKAMLANFRKVGTLISMMLFLTVLLVWLRSFRIDEELVWTGGHSNSWRRYEFLSANHGIRLGFLERTLTSAPPQDERNQNYIAEDHGLKYSRNTARSAWDPVALDSGRSGVVPGDHFWQWHQFAYYSGQFRSSGAQITMRYLRFPHILLILILALPVGIAIISIIRRKRSRSGQIQTLCAKCGYDLRATPNRCPECGAQSVLRPDNGAT